MVSKQEVIETLEIANSPKRNAADVHSAIEKAITYLKEEDVKANPIEPPVIKGVSQPVLLAEDYKEIKRLLEILQGKFIEWLTPMTDEINTKSLSGDINIMERILNKLSR